VSAPPLKTSSYLVLGLIRGGFTSGYAIRATIEGMRMSMYWGASFAQIYSELAQLERDGYISGREDPQGGRQRTAYELTRQGEEAFMTWMKSPELPRMEVRDEGIMRLGFGDHLSPEEGLELLARLRARAELSEREFREEMMPLADSVREHGWHYAATVAQLGAEYNAWAARFFAEIEDQMRSS
jgi:DNA-binding PadR family transcriptional regulator